MNKLIFERFAAIPPKQWKQKIQYELQGEDYQKKLITTTLDGISSLPFYTAEDCPKHILVTFPNKQHATANIDVTTAEEGNKLAIEAITKGASAIYFTVFSKDIIPKTLLDSISVPVFINCYFLSYEYTQRVLAESKNNNITLLIDPLSKLAQTGNWYRNSIRDFERTQQILKLTPSCLSINTSLYHNAGANSVQQLAYSLAQLDQYIATLNVAHINIINYQVATGTDFFMETAKLKALRILHNNYCEVKKLTIPCSLIQVKSKRNLHAINTTINFHLAEAEQTIGIHGGSDFISTIPQRYFYFKEDNQEASKHIPDLVKQVTTHSNNNLFTENFYTEKLTQQLIIKTTKLFETITQGGGFTNQLQKGLLQGKISNNEKIEQLQFEKVHTEIETPEIVSKKTPASYPFVRPKKHITLWKPITERRLPASLEKPIWKNLFEL